MVNALAYFIALQMARNVVDTDADLVLRRLAVADDERCVQVMLLSDPPQPSVMCFSPPKERK